MCVKGYWRHIHRQCDERSSAYTLEKAKERKDYGRHRSRRQYANVTKSRRNAAIKFEEETGNHGAVAMIDTDLASDILSCGESDLVVGFQWRRVDYVAFRRFPTLKSMKDSSSEGAKDVAVYPPTVQDDAMSAAADNVVESSGERPSKRRTTVTSALTRPRKMRKKVWDVSPDKLSDRKPASGKNSPPFANTVCNTWKEEHHDMKVLERVPWLKWFYEQLKDSDDIFEEDRTYLQQLDEGSLTREFEDEGGYSGQAKR
ncbi:hypothetical protein F4604DRAFT_1927433 [Suillus subluteus]|nr:hypothetical protein F4604DRAFT_1927433 [Suillus subluteus]